MNGAGGPHQLPHPGRAVHGCLPAGDGGHQFDEITVGRIDVVDASGALRLVISNKDRMHPGMMDGRLIDRPRRVTVSLSDAAGKPRLTLTVDADGNPRIEFLDGEGKIVSRLPLK